jgi:uncharacterized membrane protein YoaK (UPF0700 family)
VVPGWGRIRPSFAISTGSRNPLQNGMAAQPTSEYSARWNFTILMLAIIGGSLDAIIYRAFHTMSGAQSGNTILLGVALAEGQFSLVRIRVLSFCGYVLGAAAGQIIVMRHRRPWPSSIGWLQVIAIAFIGGLLGFWRLSGSHPRPVAAYAISAAAAFVMGIQSAIVLDLPGEPPTTTYITGMLTRFVTNVVKFLHLVETEAVDREWEAGPRNQQAPWIYGLTWLVYVAGATVGLVLFSHVSEMALLLPLGTAVIVFVLSGTLPDQPDKMDPQRSP